MAKGSKMAGATIGAVVVAIPPLHSKLVLTLVPTIKPGQLRLTLTLIAAPNFFSSSPT